MKKEMEVRAQKINTILEAKGSRLRIHYEKIYKNGEPLDAYMLEDGKNGSCCPVLYFAKSWWQMGDYGLAGYLEALFLASVPGNSFDAGKIATREYIQEHIYPRLRPDNDREGVTAQQLVYEELCGLIVTLYVAVPEVHGTIQVQSRFLERAGVDIEEAFALAKRNQEAATDIQTMQELLAGMCLQAKGASDFPQPSPGEPAMLVVTNLSKSYGAAAMACKSVLWEVRERLGGDFYILPSSVHEVIAVPCTCGNDVDALVAMVQAINQKEVAPEERLSDHVYRSDGRNVYQAA